MSGSEASSRIILDGLRKGLEDAGMAEGNGVILEIIYADGKVDRLDALAAEVISAPTLCLLAATKDHLPLNAQHPDNCQSLRLRATRLQRVS